MEIKPSSELLADLFDEYTAWYLGLADEYGTLPRSISGINPNGEQFIYLLDDLELHHMTRNKYLRFVLDQFGAVMYAYAGIDVRGDSSVAEVTEVLSVVVADENQFLSGDWQVVRGEEGRIMDLAERGVRRGSDPGEHPGSWFLTGAVSFSEAENNRFSGLWGEAMPDVIFKDRGEEE